MKDDRPPPNPKDEYRKATLAALKAYHRGGTISERYGPALEVLVAESDRGAIILVAGILDDLLGERIVSQLKAGKAHRETLLGRSGVISGFQDRLEIARAMGIIEQDTYDDIDIVKQLRNKCAHTIGPVSLKFPVFNDVLGLLVDNLTARDMRDLGTTDNALRNILSFCMVYLIERIMGKTDAQANQTVYQLGQDILVKRESSHETPPTQSDQADHPDHEGKKPTRPPESS